jgi:hypothetical protein
MVWRPFITVAVFVVSNFFFLVKTDVIDKKAARILAKTVCPALRVLYDRTKIASHGKTSCVFVRCFLISQTSVDVDLPSISNAPHHWQLATRHIII